MRHLAGNFVCPAARFAYNSGSRVPACITEAARLLGEFMILDNVGIQKILPHRYPFLFVDAVLEIERLKRIVAIKNVSINEPFFQGHFPGKPIMPGVIIIESMAQTGGLLLMSEIEERDKKLFYLAAVDESRFRRPVVPGDQLRIEVTVLKWKVKFCKLQAVATVNGDVAAEAILRCMLVDRETDAVSGGARATDAVGVRDE
jgi:3-hydroxyacyl-[acyl-carrier-protein] dehydratase